ncbi:chromate resistance protein ChrB domain-containing protein [Acinetobacter rongchengensis]|uniref:Chromate resistance protein n=1 Tax=Acinetobacter rongchengensis TaxID=2419601 RepID=A0A3A8FK25_9GAMM|nr:chromate resistance protein ChrB domain-containing protein [Acinetobacter rongchengensis]RKG41023.1 chromate resistance protein [Acinetobacter rongchengensis]
MKISLLISSLPTESAATRMRVWRSIKNCGAATLRDGVYLLPSTHANKFDDISQDHHSEQGKAYIFNCHCPENIDLVKLFDRNEEYSSFLKQLKMLENELDVTKKNEHLKHIRKLKKSLNQLMQIDYFPQPIQEQSIQALNELEYQIVRLGEIHEPQISLQTIHVLQAEHFQNRVWATRKRPWIDRLASAWLIQKFIDPYAKFKWLASPTDCPSDAIGFDFDGAKFTHIDCFVTFEVLMHSFNQIDPALNKIAEIVHYLDIGGHEPAEAVGFEKVIHGLKTTILDDDQLLILSNHIFDGLYADLLGESLEH